MPRAATEAGPRPARQLRHAQASFGNLAENRQHRFALDYAIAVYATNTVFTFIPKNGCSTLRYSAALANGVITGPDGVKWIHQNNVTFRPTHGELVTAGYTFVVLRCPYRRLVSCFLHRIVDFPSEVQKLYPGAIAQQWGLPRLLERGLRKVQRRVTKHGMVRSEDVSFARFVSLLESPGGLDLDIRWRPQVDFLVYRDYDDIFRLEDMERLMNTVPERSGFKVVDARSLTRHGNENREHVSDGFHGQTSVRELRKMKQQMRVPEYGSFYDADLYRRVGQLYRADVALYAETFGEAALLPLTLGK